MAATKPFITFRPGPTEMAPPTKLKKPYLFSLPIIDLEKWIKDTKAMMKRLEAVHSVQYLCSRDRSVSKGKYISISALAFRPQYCGDARGLTKEQWDALCDELTAYINFSFPGAKPYKEPWSNKHKFQYSFETYVQYAELVVP